jgi:hypothetical protein
MPSVQVLQICRQLRWSQAAVGLNNCCVSAHP